jgi:undecaprenyl diphosphate synthase
MDGNRRYGKSKYGAGVRGHSDGSKTLVAFTDWCIEAGIQALTVFAFSTGRLLLFSWAAIGIEVTVAF